MGDDTSLPHTLITDVGQWLFSSASHRIPLSCFPARGSSGFRLLVAAARVRRHDAPCRRLAVRASVVDRNVGGSFGLGLPVLGPECVARAVELGLRSFGGHLEHLRPALGLDVDVEFIVHVDPGLPPHADLDHALGVDTLGGGLGDHPGLLQAVSGLVLDERAGQEVCVRRHTTILPENAPAGKTRA